MRNAKTDANQSEIVKALRLAGATVRVLSHVGEGFPDILAGKNGRNFLLEIKDPNQPPSKRRLTEDERAFHASWLGHIAIVETAEEALKEICK